MRMESLLNYFPELTAVQIEKFERLKDLYQEWNSRINVISRKDMDNFYIHHVLHSLAIAKCIRFVPGTQILDVGTGGGFPGIPLAIMFPECEFHLVDSIAKKIKVVDEISSGLMLRNVYAEQKRAEEVKKQFDFVVSRAVTTLPEFVAWVQNSIKKTQQNALENGILYLKGGEIENELSSLKYQSRIFPIKEIFSEDFFETKLVVHLFR